MYPCLSENPQNRVCGLVGTWWVPVSPFHSPGGGSSGVCVNNYLVNLLDRVPDESHKVEVRHTSLKPNTGSTTETDGRGSSHSSS